MDTKKSYSLSEKSVDLYVPQKLGESGRRFPHIKFDQGEYSSIKIKNRYQAVRRCGF